MSQITTGLRAILSHPVVYDTLQAVMGSGRVRSDLVETFVRPAPGMRVLDIGCGTGTILAYLPNDVAYRGYDISSEYIAAARSRFPQRGQFHCATLDDAIVDGLQDYDVVLAIAVLHHLDDDVAEKLVGQARQVLGASGRLITIDPCFAPGQNPVARYLIRNDRGRNVRDSQGYLRIARRAFTTVNGTLRHRRWIPYTHWIMECSN